MGDLDMPPQEPGSGEEPTRVDARVPPVTKKPSPATMPPRAAPPPPQALEPEATVITEGNIEIPLGPVEPLPEGPVPVQELLKLSPDLEVPVIVVMGRKSVTVRDLLSLRMGQIVDLGRNPQEPVELVAAGKVIGRGELVEIDGGLGVRILKLLK